MGEIDLGKSLYVCANNSPLSNYDANGADPQAGDAGNQVTLPKQLGHCLDAGQQAMLKQKLTNTNCAKALKQVCRTQGGSDAINDPAVVPHWRFPQRHDKGNPQGLCNPKDPTEGGHCGVKGHTDPNTGKPQVGGPCLPQGICISNFICNSKNRSMGPCGVIWELTNACVCAGNYYDPNEKANPLVMHICGCANSGIIGGGSNF